MYCRIWRSTGGKTFSFFTDSASEPACFMNVVWAAPRLETKSKMKIWASTFLPCEFFSGGKWPSFYTREWKITYHCASLIWLGRSALLLLWALHWLAFDSIQHAFWKAPHDALLSLTPNKDCICQKGTQAFFMSCRSAGCLDDRDRCWLLLLLSSLPIVLHSTND